MIDKNNLYLNTIIWGTQKFFKRAKSRFRTISIFVPEKHKRIKVHICICFVVLKVYKELERMQKNSKIKMNVDNC